VRRRADAFLHRGIAGELAASGFGKTRMAFSMFIRSKSILLMLAPIACLGIANAFAQELNRSWAAIAIFCVPAHGGCKGITGGGAYGRTAALARHAAIADCKNGDIDLSQARYCKIVRAFNRGCLYVVAGCRKPSVCGYGVGPTVREASSRCTAQGFDCSKPQFTAGGCVGN
jgi:hypothetical protein